MKNQILTVRSTRTKQTNFMLLPRTRQMQKNEFTETIRAMAALLGDTKLLNKLSNDMRSSELYYHNNCHQEYKRKYNNKNFNKVENSDITYDEISVLTSIKIT